MFTDCAHYVTKLQANPWYNLLITVLAAVSITLLVIEIWWTPAAATLEQFHELDLIIAWIFLSDFFAGLLWNQALTRRDYWRRNWLNLFSSIPISSELTQMLRILRIWRAARVIRVSANFWFARTRLHYSKQRTLPTKSAVR
jgi:hypothetical protein